MNDPGLSMTRRSGSLTARNLFQGREVCIAVEPRDDRQSLPLQVLVKFRLPPAFPQQHRKAGVGALDQRGPQAKIRKPPVERRRGVKPPGLADDVILSAGVGREGHLLVCFQANAAAVTQADAAPNRERSWRIDRDEL